ncbi:MAG: NUDIX hydrolase N-terminal domain-containing protein [Spirochaetaceae bacterium]|nr:NUDIX hydrolase N-terminal domain-containing protein [Spirochaetaceae bacterium]
MSFQDEVYLIADELRSIANAGVFYAENEYDRERYERALSLSARLVAAIEKRPADDVMEEYRQSLMHVSPLVGADAAVFRDGRMLLIKREDNGLWAMPGGATDVGETWAQSAERELREETGVAGTATKLLGVFDSRLWGSRSKYHFYSGVWLVEPHDDRTPMAGPETTGAGFFAEHDLPSLSPGHERRIPMAFKLARGEMPVPYFDPTP